MSCPGTVPGRADVLSICSCLAFSSSLAGLILLGVVASHSTRVQTV